MKAIKILFALSAAITIPVQAGMSIKQSIKNNRAAFGWTCAGMTLAGLSYAQKLRSIKAQIKKEKSSLKPKDVSFFTPHAANLKKILGELKGMQRLNLSLRNDCKTLRKEIYAAIDDRVRYAAACTGLAAIMWAVGLYVTK